LLASAVRRCRPKARLRCDVALNQFSYKLLQLSPKVTGRSSIFYV
jgi:hypothetical protein